MSTTESRFWRGLAAVVVAMIVATVENTARANDPIEVYYNPTGAPGVFASNPERVERAIQYTIREYEQFLNGKAFMKWVGTTNSPPYGQMTMHIVWDPTVVVAGVPACARTEAIAGQGVNVVLNASQYVGAGTEGVVVPPAGSFMACTPCASG